MASPGKVLVLDDDQTVLDLIVELIEARGFEVVAYSRVAEARSMLSSASPPQAIVLDVMMPEVDGYTFLNELQANDSTRGIPVIMLTAKKGMIDVFRSAANVFAFLEKPMGVHMVGDAVSRAIKSKAG